MHPCAVGRGGGEFCFSLCPAAGGGLKLGVSRPHVNADSLVAFGGLNWSRGLWERNSEHFSWSKRLQPGNYLDTWIVLLLCSKRSALQAPFRMLPPSFLRAGGQGT